MGCIGGCFSFLGNIIYYIVNLVFLLVGIAFICGGTILMISFDCTVNTLLFQFFTAIGMPSVPPSVTNASSEININTTAIVLLASGGFLVLLALLAFLGSVVKWIEKVAAFIYILLAFVLLGAFIFVIVYFALPEKPKDIDVVTYTLAALLKNYKPTTGKVDDVTLEGSLVDMVQSYFHCCGVNGYKDYADKSMAPVFVDQLFDMTLWLGTASQKIAVPPTCCRTKVEINATSTENTAYKPAMGVPYFPTPLVVSAPACYETPTDELTHTLRACPAVIYQVAGDYTTWIIVVASILTAVFLILICGLFVKLCSSSKKTEKKDAENRPPAQPTPQPVPTVSPSAYPGAYQPAPQAYPGYPQAYPGYPQAYPGYPK